MPQKNQTIIGLDIGGTSVKCVEVRVDKEGVVLERAVVKPLGSGRELLPELRSFLGENPAEKRVRVSVSGSLVLIRRITLPFMTQEELKGAIGFEAEKHIPFPIHDCVLDFQILPSPAKDTMSILLVAAKKELVQGRLETMAALGVQPEIMDVDILCFVNAFEQLGGPGEKSCGLLNIGHHSSSFTILQEGNPFLVREIPAGGYGVTKALAQMKAIPEPEAEKLKMQAPADASLELEQATAQGFEPLLKELRHSIDYYENEAGDELKKLCIGGGGALSKNAKDILSRELGKAVDLWDGAAKIRSGVSVTPEFLAHDGPLLGVALGMVLRGAVLK